jgi:hypothetical protein
MYISALLVVVGEAWLFRSLPLLTYAGAAAIFFHLFVIGYEEVALGRRFGETYAEYRRTVPRWLPAAGAQFHVVTCLSRLPRISLPRPSVNTQRGPRRGR